MTTATTFGDVYAVKVERIERNRAAPWYQIRLQDKNGIDLGDVCIFPARDALPGGMLALDYAAEETAGIEAEKAKGGVGANDQGT